MTAIRDLSGNLLTPALTHVMMNDVSFIEESRELGPRASPLRCDVTRSHTVAVSGNEQMASGFVRFSAYLSVELINQVYKICRVKIATHIKAHRDEFQTF